MSGVSAETAQAVAAIRQYLAAVTADNSLRAWVTGSVATAVPVARPTLGGWGSTTRR